MQVIAIETVTAAARRRRVRLRPSGERFYAGLANQELDSRARIVPEFAQPMKVIVNSDILYSGTLLTRRLPERVERLFRASAEVGAGILVTRTILLEFERQQERCAQDARTKLDNACAILEEFGVPFTRSSPDEVIKPRGLSDFVADLGLELEIEEPTLEDFQSAHKRACLHLAPQPPDAKSDEMRDLVIWTTALRVAKREGSALLVSRDVVHTHTRGDAEADAAGLRRAGEVDEALRILQLETPAGSLARKLILPVWEDLRAAGLPLSPDVSLCGVSDAAFVQGEGLPTVARFRLQARTSDDRLLSAEVELRQSDSTINYVALADIRIGDDLWGPGATILSPNRRVETTPTDFDERMNALRAVFGRRT